MFNNRKNDPVESKDGKVIWHSRSVATVVAILRPSPKDSSVLQVLGVKRGEKVNNSGKWCIPCGYLDWEEDIADCARREVFEETGIVLDRNDLEFYELNSNPKKDDLQNVTAHFVAYLTREVTPSAENAEPGEVEELKWFDISDVENYDWAFGHKERIMNLIKN